MKRSLVWSLLALMAFTLLSTIFWEMDGIVLPVRFVPAASVPATPLPPTPSQSDPTTEVMRTTIEPIPDRKPGCDPIGNIIFIKTHKTGSTTTRVILNRYGIFNNLSFLQHKSKAGGHVVSDLNRLPRGVFLPPRGVRTGDTKRYKGYNISNTHVRMSVQKMSELMNPNSTYITILRHPVQQWLSAFQYFHVSHSFRKFKSTEKDRIKVFLSDPKRFSAKSSFAWNNQLHDLGMSRSQFKNWTYIGQRMKYFSKLFGLVLITEYFDESLILLRDLLCWTFEDILYVKMRQQPKPLEASASVQRQIWEWNKADAMLYTFFNQTLWRRIRDYGSNFERDLEHFRGLLCDKYDECLGQKEVVKVSGNHKNVIYGVKNHTEFCEALLGHGLVETIHDRQSSEPTMEPAKISNVSSDLRSLSTLEVPNQKIPDEASAAADPNSKNEALSRAHADPTKDVKLIVLKVPTRDGKPTKRKEPTKYRKPPKYKEPTKHKEPTKYKEPIKRKKPTKDKEPTMTEVVNRQCNKSRGNIVFVKTHKTGSTTLTSILNRFGYARKLSFVQMTAPGAGHFNYHTPTLSRRQEFLPPIGVSEGDFENYSGYNISAVHIRYSRGLMEALMGDSVTYYITILREPVSQFVAAYRYFDVAKNLPESTRTHLSMEESILEFLELPRSVFLRGPFTWNNQIYDLGMKKGRMLSSAYAQDHIAQLGRELDLVLIMEYFDESLILLRKLLCWEYEDILYVKMRVQPSYAGGIPHSTMDRILKHNHADEMLYRHFNATLWKQIAEYGPSFQDDLRTFKVLLNKTLGSCVKGTVVAKLNRGQENIKHVLAENASTLCNDVIDTQRITEQIRRRQGGLYSPE